MRSIENTVFSNEHFIVLNKQAGELVIPPRDVEKDKRPVLVRQIEDELKTKIFVVHRIDAEVSGLVLFAKNAEAHKAANHWFESHEVEKSYHALSILQPELVSPWTESQVWRSLLVRGKRRTFEAPHGKPSVTRAKFDGILFYDNRNVSSWVLQPITGRTHQLRVEMSKRGFPILGDELYGSKDSFNFPGIALRCFRIKFPVGAINFGLPEFLEIARFQ